ncbi:MAG: hypothetical protein NWF02_09300 [Candidatus Bathyarchaeota archaeon]|nr:hypothetical protein [Candidatus Bathyarchaeum sp.]
MSKKEIQKIENIFYIIIALAIVFALLHVPDDITNWVLNALVGLVVSSVCSVVAGSLVKAFTGDWLKKIAINKKIFGINFSITIFAIVTFIVEKWIFGF